MRSKKDQVLQWISGDRHIRNLAKKIMRTLWWLEYRLIRAFTKTDEKLFVFEVYQGRQYTCSPRAIYEELLKKEAKEGFRFIWVFREPQNYPELAKIPGTSLVKLGSPAYYRAFARARYWIVNSRTRHCLVPGKDQIFVNTWHGTPFKRIGCDIMVDGSNNMVSLNDMKKDYRKEGKRVTYFLSPSRFYSEKIASAFSLKGKAEKQKIVESGYPRNDRLFTIQADEIERIKEKLGIEKSKKVILYAPTFRDNQHTGSGLAFTLGFSPENFVRAFGDDYVMLFRTHYFVTEHLNLQALKPAVIDVTQYDEINELYAVSDMLITDYSSVFFDYANMRKPMLFFMYDIEEYRDNLRDFYLEPEELPGEIVRTEEELFAAIPRTAVKAELSANYQNFRDRFNYLDGPHTSRKVIRWLLTRPSIRK